MNTIFVFILLIVVLLGLFFIIPNLLTRRAVIKLIKMFQQNNAVGIKNARTAEELGLSFPTLMQRMVMPRDYKPRALQALMNAGIIGITEEGKMYLVEENIADRILLKR